MRVDPRVFESQVNSGNDTKGEREREKGFDTTCSLHTELLHCGCFFPIASQ